MLVLVPAAPPAPALFRARMVSVGLEGDVWLADVRRDGRAVGTATTRMTIGDGPSRSFVVFGDDAGVGEGPGDGWESWPVGITGTRSFAVAFRRAGTKRTVVRAARLAGRRIVVGGRTAAPKPSLKGVAFGPRSEVAFRREWWPPVSEPGAIFADRGEVAWARLGPGIEIGEVHATEWGSEGGGDRQLRGDREVALVRSGGRVETLAARTVGVPSAGLGDVLYVSREGWLVVVVGPGHGLAWLEPVRR